MLIQTNIIIFDISIYLRCTKYCTNVQTGSFSVLKSGIRIQIFVHGSKNAIILLSLEVLFLHLFLRIFCHSDPDPLTLIIWGGGGGQIVSCFAKKIVKGASVLTIITLILINNYLCLILL